MVMSNWASGVFQKCPLKIVTNCVSPLMHAVKASLQINCPYACKSDLSEAIYRNYLL